MPFFCEMVMIPIHNTLLITFGGSNLFLCCLALCWTRSRSLLKESNSSFGGYSQEDISTFYNPMGDVLFGIGSLQIAINFLLPLLSFSFYGVNKGKYISVSGEATLEEFNYNYVIFFGITSLLTILVSFIIGTFVYAAYHASVTFKTLRIVANLYNVYLFILTCLS